MYVLRRGTNAAGSLFGAQSCACGIQRCTSSWAACAEGYAAWRRCVRVQLCVRVYSVCPNSSEIAHLRSWGEGPDLRSWGKGPIAGRGEKGPISGRERPPKNLRLARAACALLAHHTAVCHARCISCIPCAVRAQCRKPARPLTQRHSPHSPAAPCAPPAQSPRPAPVTPAPRAQRRRGRACARSSIGPSWSTGRAAAPTRPAPRLGGRGSASR